MHELPRLYTPEDSSATLSTTEKPTVAKAVVAVCAALGTAIATAIADGNVTVWEIVLGILTAVGTGGAVWATSNEP